MTKYIGIFDCKRLLRKLQIS